MTRVAALVVALMVLTAPRTGAQVRRPPAPPASPNQGVNLRGSGDIGATAFAASDSFTAVLGSRVGIVFGGGIEIVLPRRVFVGLHVSRFTKDGTRVFAFEGDVFDLGIPTTVTMTPIEVSGGYRFSSSRSSVIPYIGGGIGWHRYEEASSFADDNENVDERHTGYHLLGGAELRLHRLLGVAGEAQWTSVPGAIGADTSGVSAAFDETDLGGATFRVKFVIGR